MTNIKTMSETFYGYKKLNVFQCIHLVPFKVMGKCKRKANHVTQSKIPFKEGLFI